MRVKVAKGYVTYQKQLYGVGSILEVDDDNGARLIAKGVLEPVEQAKKPTKAPKTAPKAKVEPDGELPPADPVAAIKRKEK